MVVVLELVAHGKNRHLAFALDLEQGDIARSSERNDQVSDEPACPAVRHVNGEVFCVAPPERTAAIA
jgi:hypothetical protein